MGEQLVFWRDHAGQPVCLRDFCPHRGVAKSTGKLIGDLYIIRQDRWVVLTERPKVTGLRIGEQLVPGDQPIILYRRRREELQK